jgi:hypothetical protein
MPAITKPNQHFDATTYTGTGSARSVTGVGFQPDFVWIKERSSTSGHALFDVVRGVQKRLVSNTTDAEDTSAQLLTAFNSDGFSVGTDGAINENTQTYIGWQWKAGGTAVSNTSGTITSSVSANPTAGFSVVTYTGTGANATVGHGLGVAPSMIIVKNRTTAATSWNVYHISTGNTGAMFLETTNAFAADSTRWNNTTPTSTVFSIGSGAGVNQSTNNLVAYCFSAVAGYSAFGSYTGNGSSDGPFVYLGFRPRWIMIKNTTAASAGSWRIYDTSRATYNADGTLLWADLASAEVTDASYQLDHVSNGFKIRNTSSDFNANSNTYIYAAFAEAPFKYSNGR